MIKVIEEKPVPTARVRCKNCGSLLEYGNADLWEELNTNYNNYPMFYKHYFNCPVCKCKVEVEKIALKGD